MRRGRHSRPRRIRGSIFQPGSVLIHGTVLPHSAATHRVFPIRLTPPVLKPPPHMPSAATQKRSQPFPGADLGLRLLPRLIAARSVAIVAPTYQGHHAAWAAADVKVREIGFADLASADADVIVLVNPNNPDGAVASPRTLRALAQRQRARNGWLIVDESFSETVPTASVARAAGKGLIILRSFGKFYGLPGLRLGFILADEQVTAKVRTLTGDWPVSAAAVRTGTAAYADQAWRARNAKRLGADAVRLDALLRDHGFQVLGGTSLFRLVGHPAADKVFLTLARAGILVRPFAHAPTWLRFGIPAPRAWTRLRAALEACP